MRPLLWVPVLLVAGSCGATAPAPVAPVFPSPSPVVAVASPLVELDRLPVRAKVPIGGYQRTAEFMPHGWADPDGNGCDARRDALARQKVPGTEVTAGRHHCVLTATILDPYTGQTVSSKGADADHVVALGDAWQTGAQQLAQAEREALAQDPDNLVATTAAVNRAKGDKDAAEWLPPAKGYRCAYVARQIVVKTRYKLWVTAGERDAMRAVLEHC